MIDLNRADRTELMLLDSIGPELADRIVAYRQQHGPFEGLADLKKVNGVGPVTLERIRPRVTLSWSNRPANAEELPPSLTIAPASLSVMANVAKADSQATLDPNRASLQELDTLPGIGPKIAQRIIDERSRKPFAQVADLRRVPGIGAKTLEKISPRLKIGTETGARVQ